MFWFFLFLILSYFQEVYCGKEQIRRETESLKDIPYKVFNSENTTNYYNQIMFWRPQKVGSSTIVSLFVSYAYRYNFIQKRKGVQNSLW